MLITNAPDAWDDPGPTGGDGVYADWTTYTRALKDAGILADGKGLHDAETATSVGVRNGKRVLQPRLESESPCPFPARFALCFLGSS